MCPLSNPSLLPWRTEFGFLAKLSWSDLFQLPPEPTSGLSNTLSSLGGAEFWYMVAGLSCSSALDIPRAFSTVCTWAQGLPLLLQGKELSPDLSAEGVQSRFGRRRLLWCFRPGSGIEITAVAWCFAIGLELAAPLGHRRQAAPVSKALRPGGRPLEKKLHSMTSGWTRLPAEFKHIIERRKRKQR